MRQFLFQQYLQIFNMGNTYFCQGQHQNQQACNNHPLSEQNSHKINNLSNFRQNSSATANPYMPCRYLGKGIYGSTVEVFSKQKKEQRFAKKVSKTDWISENYLFLNLALFKQINNSHNFVHIKRIRFQGIKMYTLMQKLSAGDLYNFIKKNSKQIDEQMIRQICIKLIVILQKIHAKGLIYRSLRPQNVLFTGREGQIQFSEVMFSLTDQKSLSYYGAAVYTPPQVYKRQAPYNNSIDVWMLGVLICEFLLLENPFQSANIQQIKQKVINFSPQSLKYPSEMHVSQNLRDLLNNLLNPIPQSRITLQQAKDHCFFKGQSWSGNRDPISYLQIKQNIQKQQYQRPNRLIYSYFEQSKPLTREFTDQIFDQKSGQSI